MRVHYPFLHHIQTSTPPLGPHQRTQIQKPGLKFHLSSTWRGPLIFVHFDNQGLGHGLSNHHQSFPMNVEMEREESIQREQGGKRGSKISSHGPLPNLRKNPATWIQSIQYWCFLRKLSLSCEKWTFSSWKCKVQKCSFPVVSQVKALFQWFSKCLLFYYNDLRERAKWQ